MSKHYRVISEPAFEGLRSWHAQALKYEHNPTQHPLPDYRLLLLDWSEWPRGLTAEPTLQSSGLLRLWFNKPSGEAELTHRDVSPPELFLARVHAVAGGRMDVEPHGVGGGIWYLRLTLPGRRKDGSKRRFYILRAAARTEQGLLTREPKDFHKLDPASIDDARGQPKMGAHAKIGWREAGEFTIDALREAKGRGEQLPSGLDEALVRQWLDDWPRGEELKPAAE